MKALFLSDNHYGTFGGRELLPVFEGLFEVVYREDDYGSFLVDVDLATYDLLITCAIGDTPGGPHAPVEAESRVKAWMELGRPVFCLHGGSATFWKWSWWREAVGLRWVRGEDPDGFEASTHPISPYEVKRCKTRHPLAKQLEEWRAPEDELYIDLEETRPVQRLLETSWEGRSFPLAWACRNQWGGLVLGYLPGHDPKVIRNSGLQQNVAAMACFVGEQVTPQPFGR